jgi:hypothetical protein
MAQKVPEGHGFHEFAGGHAEKKIPEKKLSVRADHPKGVDCFKIRDSTPMRRTPCA